MQQFIPLSVPNLRGNELSYVTKAIEEEWVSTAGSYITQFEENLASYVHTPFAVACQSGTSGLHLSLMCLGVKKDDEVIVPTLTFIAAVNPVSYLGAHPVFMDCDDSLTMDPVKLRRFCEEECIFQNGVLRNKQTNRMIRAIIVVHVFGNLADLESILSIARLYHLSVIEDATEALGSYYTSGEYQGRFAGTIADMGVYSFNGNKIITTGGGGMVVTNEEAYATHCRHLSTQAKSDPLYFDHDEIGYNYRMTNLQAALGLAQLEQLETFIKTKKDNFDAYQEAGIELHPFRENARPNYWFYAYRTKHRDELIAQLSENQIQTRPIWKLIHTTKPYVTAQHYQIEKADYYYKQIVNLPCSTNLTKEQVLQVADTIHQIESRL